MSAGVESGAAKMPSEIAVVSAAYMLSSSALLVTNKLCVQRVNAPSCLHGVQFAFTAAFVLSLRASGRSDSVDGFEWAKAKPYMIYVLVFFSAAYCNMAALRVASVGTVLVVRACCPLAVCVVEWLALGRHLPSRASALALGVVAISALAYVRSDEELRLQPGAEATVAAYYVMICASDALSKRLVHGVAFRSMWGPVLYTNALSLPPVAAAAALTREGAALRATATLWSRATLGLVGLSCVLAVCISYFAWRCRRLVAATTFTLLGIANKLGSVLAAALIWDPPTPRGAACLITCLAATAAYRAPPLRAPGSPHPLRGLAAAPSAPAAAGAAALLALALAAAAAHYGGAWDS